MFLASDFAWSAVQSPLEAAGRYAKSGDPKHMWLATQDVFPDAVKAMEEGYIDVGTTYDAYNHAKEAIRVVILIAEKKPVDCGPNGCLAKGRLATQANIDTLENLWSCEVADETAGRRPADAPAGLTVKEKHDGYGRGAARSDGFRRQGGAGHGGRRGNRPRRRRCVRDARR